MSSLIKTLSLTALAVAGVYVAAATIATNMAGEPAAARATTLLHKPVAAGNRVVPDAALYRAHRELADTQIGCNKPDQVDVFPRPRKRFLDVAMK